MLGWLRSAIETVVGCTPARLATSAIVIRRFIVFSGTLGGCRICVPPASWGWSRQAFEDSNWASQTALAGDERADKGTRCSSTCPSADDWTNHRRTGNQIPIDPTRALVGAGHRKHGFRRHTPGWRFADGGDPVRWASRGGSRQSSVGQAAVGGTGSWNSGCAQVPLFLVPEARS